MSLPSPRLEANVLSPICRRNAVTVTGQGKPLIFLHGYGCDQTMWRYIAPEFSAHRQVILYDHTGSGRSDLGAYDKSRYATLHGYADDLIEICEDMELRAADVIGHSAGGMIAALAAKKRPDLFDRLMLLGPSPCYINSGDYFGGFERDGIDELLTFLELNHEAWAATMAPVVMGNADRPELAAELEAYFRNNDPAIAHHFARTVYYSDHRADLAGMTKPCLIMQCADDVVVPMEVGEYLHQHLVNSRLVVLDAHGHYPQFSAPALVTAAMRDYLDT